MQMLVTQGGLAGLRAGGVGVGEGLWASAEGPHGSFPILVAEAEAPRTRSVTLPLHADSAEGKGPKLAWPMFQSDVSAGLGEGRAEEGWEGDRMGVGQHLQHLLICITTDTLLDQENGARNNKGEGGFPGGTFEVLFPCSNTPSAEGKRAATPSHHSPAPGREMYLYLLLPPQVGQSPRPSPHLPWPREPQPGPFLGSPHHLPPVLWEPSPRSPSHSGAGPALPSCVVLFSSSCLPSQTRRFPGQGPDIPCHPRENILPEK